MPVLVGITDTAFVESLNVARTAGEAGADAVVLATPYYFPAGQTELIAYVQHLTQELPLPVMLYNMPSLTKVWFEIDTLRQLSEIDSILGMKDSSGDLDYFRRLVSLRDIAAGLVDPDRPRNLLCEAMDLGADGGVCGGANVLPQLFVGCYEAAVRGDRVQAAALIAADRRLPGDLHDRQVCLAVHQGHQECAVLVGHLQRLHGRAIQSLPATAAAASAGGAAALRGRGSPGLVRRSGLRLPVRPASRC